MSGETEESVSGWTVDTLRAYFERILAEMDRRHASERADDKEAVRIALGANDERLKGMNEFRDTLRDQNSTFITRAEAQAFVATLEVQVDASTARLDKLEGAADGGSKTWALAATLVTVIVGMLAVITTIIISTR